MIKALVVDSDSVFQNLLCKLLGSHGIQVVGRASGAQQAELLYKATWPDVVLLDLSSQDEQRLETISRIKEIDPEAKVIVFSIFNAFEDVSAEHSNLVDAHVVKGSSAKEIVNTVKHIARRKFEDVK